MRTFRSLRHRNYRLYFVGQLVSLIGSWTQTTTLMWLAHKQTGLAQWPAFLVAVQIGPTFLFGPAGGALADRVPKRRLIAVTQSGFLVAALALMGLYYAGALTLGAMLAIMFFHGCVQAVDLPARLAVVVATLPFPLGDEQEVIEAVLARASPRTRLAVLDHVTSPTALVLPVARLVAELRTRGIETLIDGAHAPGMVRLALSELGAAYYTGNAHKWLCAPKGAAFLHVRRDRQAGLHPLVISHGYTLGFHAEFDWTGTCDPTPWLCIPEAIRFMGGLLPGGWPELMTRNRELALQARDMLCAALDLDPPAPNAMIGSMASIPLPTAEPGAPAARLDSDALCEWFRDRGVRTWLYPHPVPLLRVSAQLYNDPDQYRQLATLLAEALHGG